MLPRVIGVLSLTLATAVAAQQLGRAGCLISKAGGCGSTSTGRAASMDSLRSFRAPF